MKILRVYPEELEFYITDDFKALKKIASGHGGPCL